MALLPTALSLDRIGTFNFNTSYVFTYISNCAYKYDLQSVSSEYFPLLLLVKFIYNNRRIPLRFIGLVSIYLDSFTLPTFQESFREHNEQGEIKTAIFNAYFGHFFDLFWLKSHFLVKILTFC